MTALLPDARDDLAAATKVYDELYDAADIDAIAWNYIDLIAVRKGLSDLIGVLEETLIECAPWTGDELVVEGLPVMERRYGAERKGWKWDELRTYFRRAVLDPEDSGEAPAPEVVEAVDGLLDLLYAVAPTTPSSDPRVRALRPLLNRYGVKVDEFCETKPGKVRIEIHGDAA